MAKKHKSFAHLLRPDPKYNNKLVGKFINCLMWDGKKSIAQQIFYEAINTMEKKIPDIDPLEMFTKALNNVKPSLEVKSKRVGGATYQVPIEVPTNRQISLAIRWIIHAARKKKGRPMYLRLADELVAAYKHEGDAVLAKTNVHKMAEANKAFAHFAW